MLSPCRTSVLSNARTLLLIRRYSSSIAGTSRSNAFGGLHKNFLRSGDNSTQSFLCLQQRGLRTKSKTSDATSSNSSSNEKDNKSDTGSSDFRIQDIIGGKFKVFKEEEFKQFLRDKKPNITDEEIDKIIAGSRRKVRIIKINVNYIRFVLLGIVAYLAYITFTFLERKTSQPKNASSQSGSHSAWNAPSPRPVDSDLEKKELKTGNEFDLNAIFPTATESDSGKQHGYHR